MVKITKNEARASEETTKLVEALGKQVVSVDNIVKKYFPKESESEEGKNE
jgi:hypothetical protein